MGQITDEELALLSQEERDAIAEDAADVKSTEEIRAAEEAEAARVAQETGAGAATRVVEKKVDDQVDQEAEDAAKKLAELEAEAAAAKEAAEKAEAEANANDNAEATEADDAAKLAVQKPITPAFTLESERKLGTPAEIEAKMAELDTKFEDGDITLAAYNKERASFVEALTEMKMFDKINAQVLKAAAEKAWKDAQVDFFSQNPEYSNERLKNVAFVDSVNRILATEESKTMTDAQIFDAAKKECDAVFYPNGRRGSKNADNVTDIEEKRKAVEDAKTKAIDAARKLEAEKAGKVQTLAKVPVSEANQGEDKFDIIDKLSGLAYEEAVAKMSNAERAQYAARQ